jgi:aspartyl-tRNA(Asn)/glutamyl-tRNA(Gln) amidotransferase subunit B
MEWEVVIGLEVHSELKTESKVFCGCSTKFGAEPNTHVCPICMGLPGVLPVMNRQAVDYTIAAGLATNCEIASFSKFDRKQYFYPDLPKAYQISQYDLPLCRNGWVEIETAEGKKKIGITRIHLEEEAGKSVHSTAGIAGSSYSLMDYNRCGIPLIEIVSEPDMRSPEEARLYMETLRSILLYIGVSDCKMEEGSLRCDANISIRPKGQKEFGIRAELKNMNSFRAVQAALEYEMQRQIDLAEAGTPLTTEESRGWDDTRGVTVFMRPKEAAHEYRYFPDPDLMPVVIDEQWVRSIRETLPELPDAKYRRYLEEMALPEADAKQITLSRAMAEFFEATVQEYGKDPKTVSNWVLGEFSRLLNLEKLEADEAKVKPADLASLLKLIDDGTISGKIAKSVFEEMFQTGKAPEKIVEAKGLVQISDTSELASIIARTVDASPQSVADYLAGKEKAIGFLVGQVMKETKGRANPGLVNQMLRDELEKRR